MKEMSNSYVNIGYFIYLLYIDKTFGADDLYDQRLCLQWLLSILKIMFFGRRLMTMTVWRFRKMLHICEIKKITNDFQYW